MAQIVHAHRSLADVVNDRTTFGRPLPILQIQQRPVTRHDGRRARAASGDALTKDLKKLLRYRNGPVTVSTFGLPSTSLPPTCVVDRRTRIPDIIEAREALEVKLAGLAALRRTTEEMAAIDAAIARMDEEVRSGDRGVVGDEMFHEAITAAAHSSLLAKLMHEISGLVRETRIESLSQQNRPRASLEGHKRIAEAVRRQDSIEAARAMADHIRMVSDVALLRAAE
ncbi:MAG: FCD domain-containing protein [Mycobacterium kyogaense]|uniref:FadR/GntR family transcriptional regulator n=1 Tax=Mycobacterium kyogaense TaxID=2212479 RepID=UPI002FF88A49